MNEHTKRPSVVAALAALALGGLVYPAGRAEAQTAAPYRGHAQAVAAHVDAVTLNDGATRLANVNAGVASAGLDSAELRKRTNAFGNRIGYAASDGQKSFGEGVLAQVTVAQPADAAAQIETLLLNLLSRAHAPAEQAVSRRLVPPVTVSPVVHARLMESLAAPVWNGSTCVLGAPIAQGEFQAARLQVVETSADDDTDAFDAALVGVTADAAGFRRDAVDIRAVNQLFQGNGPGFGLVSAAFAELVPVRLFEGTAAEVTVDVGGPAILRAFADGTAAGARVEFDAPLVSIVRDGVRQVILPSQPTTIELPDGSVLSIKIGVLNNESKSATTVSADGALVTVKVLESAVPNIEGVTVSLGHLEAFSQVPAGGIVCPVEVRVTADPNETQVGRTIDITTTVINHFDCPLVNVRLTDTLSITSNARFRLTEAQQAVVRTPGTFLSRGTVAWDIAKIPARGSASRIFTLRADDGAGRIRIAADADGELTNCVVRPDQTSALVSGLAAGGASVVGIAVPADLPVARVLGANPIVPQDDLLVPLGLESSAVGGLLLLAAAGGLAVVLRRRRISIEP